MNPSQIQSIISRQRVVIDNLHEDALRYKNWRTYYSQSGQPEKAEHWHKSFVKTSKDIAKLVKLQQALKKHLAASCKESRAWRSLRQPIIPQPMNLYGR